MKNDNPKNWKRQFEVIRDGKLIEIWIPPVRNSEGELIAKLHADYIPSLISDLKRFEQSENRN